MSSQDLRRRWGAARANATARSACAVLFHVWAGPPLARPGAGPSGGAGAGWVLNGVTLLDVEEVLEGWSTAVCDAACRALGTALPSVSLPGL